MALKRYFGKEFHPIIKVSGPSEKTEDCDDNGPKGGRIRFLCTHGVKRRYKATEARPIQRVNYTACHAGLNINQQTDGSWRIGLKVILDHTGHTVGPDIYSTYQFVKHLTKEDINLVADLEKAKAKPRKIAQVLTERKGGKEKFTGKDVSNIIAKLKNKSEDDKPLEDVLNEVIKEGGHVKVSKDPQTGYVDVIWLQTAAMIKQLAREKPLVFQSDTTFSTNAESYKLLLPVYTSTVTDMTEYAGLLFLRTETQEFVEKGLQFSMKLCSSQVGI